MYTTPSFVKNVLPAGKIPGMEAHYSDLSDLSITIPFALMGWDDGLDGGYQDSPPTDYVVGAFENRDEAEDQLASCVQNNPAGIYWIVESYQEPLYSFNSVSWEGINREAYLSMSLTREDVIRLESRLVREKTQSDHTVVRLA